MHTIHREEIKTPQRLPECFIAGWLSGKPEMISSHMECKTQPAANSWSDVLPGQCQVDTQRQCQNLVAH